VYKAAKQWHIAMVLQPSDKGHINKKLFLFSLRVLALQSQPSQSYVRTVSKVT
jgi:hypothetical protein